MLSLFVYFSCCLFYWGQVNPLVQQMGNIALKLSCLHGRNGLILYRTSVDAVELRTGATLFVGSKVRDSAVVRSCTFPSTLIKPAEPDTR